MTAGVTLVRTPTGSARDAGTAKAITMSAEVASVAGMPSPLAISQGPRQGAAPGRGPRGRGDRGDRGDRGAGLAEVDGGFMVWVPVGAVGTPRRPRRPGSSRRLVGGAAGGPAGRGPGCRQAGRRWR